MYFLKKCLTLYLTWRNRVTITSPSEENFEIITHIYMISCSTWKNPKNVYKCLQYLSPPEVKQYNLYTCLQSVSPPEENNTISTHAYSLFLLLKKNNAISTHAYSLFLLLKKTIQLGQLPTVCFYSWRKIVQ